MTKLVGPCYRLPAEVWLLFEAVFTLYSPTSMDSAQFTKHGDSGMSQAQLGVHLAQKMM